MRNLLYKELHLALHQTNILFLFFAAMIFIPGYPYQVAAFFSCLGVNFLCTVGRENGDIFYTALLPVRKRDIVRSRFTLVALLQLGQMVLMAILIVVKDMVMPMDNPAGLEANAALVGLCMIAFGIFNYIFFTKYYKNPQKIGVPFVICAVVLFLFMGMEIMCTVLVPFVRDRLDTRGMEFLPEKLAVLAVGLVVYAVLTLLSYRKSANSFEKLDL